MNEKERQEYLERYTEEKERGVPFFPDILFKDAVVSLLIFLLLVGLAYFLGAPLEARADPADTSYTPRPEWYFLFLFQLLKYFPGELEVIGVVVIPTLAIILLFLLPFMDRSARRHYLGRPVVVGAIALSVVGFSVLTYLSILEAPPPAEVAPGDQTAALYARNCAGCHGASITVPAGINLHGVIAEGMHEGMPAWSADLTTDEIDALAGFILSPGGSQLFTTNCGECHEAAELVASDPSELRVALEQGLDFPAHAGLEIPDWSETMSPEQRTEVLNFLVAPDGQRLFTIDCAPCHGQAVAVSGDESDLRAIISQGGLHLEMPPWRERLSREQLDTLARYVVEPTSYPEGTTLFQQICSDCHGQRVPVMRDVVAAREAIASGGAHETMPVWGNVLTPEQLDSLVRYTLDTARGASVEIGQTVYAQSCASCHGEYGEGGPNPARAGDIIAPISSAEYLKTRDDATLRAVISQGQPNFGMSPFGSAFGGPLDDSEIDALVSYIRSWEDIPPVELPPEVAATQVSLSGPMIYSEICAQCHGPEGAGTIGPSLIDPGFQASFSDQEIFDSVSFGHRASAMIAWGEILTSDQIGQVVNYVRDLGRPEGAETPVEETPSAGGAVFFSADVLPIFEAKCNMCHGTMGGWDGTSYANAVNTGDHAPVVIPGDPDNSLLAQKILGTHTEGAIMPPAGKMPDSEIKPILDWIAAGAPNN